MAALLAACGSKTANSPSSTASYASLTISDSQLWSNQQVTITGSLTINPGASLTLDNTTLLFSPSVEDTSSFTIHGGTLIAKNGSVIKSGTGKQWNLQADGACSVSFQQGSKATQHSGLRMFNTCAFTSDQSAPEEVQVHDNATLNIQNSSTAYLVLFFDGSNIASPLTQFVSGNVTSNNFTYASSPATTGHVNISNSNILGYQLDLSKNAVVSIQNATGIVLALHLNQVYGAGGTTVANSANITSTVASSTPVTVDFSSYTGNPKFTYTNSVIKSLNVYLTGGSNVSFTGTLDVVEPDVADTSILTFGSGASVRANLAMTHDSAQMIFNGSTLLDGGSFPSFTAADSSLIKLNNVIALPDARVYSVGQGRVQITGGSGWNSSMFESINPMAPGGIFVQ